MKFNILITLLFTTLINMYASDTTKPQSLYRFDGGSHFSKPRNLLSRILRTPDTLKWVSHFDKTCCYYINDEHGKMHVDQWDYNKLVGITFTPFNPLSNTAMVGWRHNPKTKLFELVAYWHVGDKRFFNEKKFLTVKPDEMFEIEISINKPKKEVTICLKTQKDQLNETKTYQNIPLLSSLIQPYFGGTSRAPNAMYLFVERVK